MTKTKRSKKEPTRLVQTRIPEEQAVKMDLHAEEAGMSAAAYLRRLILEDLQWKISLTSRVGILETQIADLKADLQAALAQPPKESP